MQRFRRREHAEAVHAILATIPGNARLWLVEVHFMTDFDPAFLGLHDGGPTEDGRSFNDTSHCAMRFGLRHLPLSERETTIVLFGPDATSTDVVLHEAGHALDERLGFDRPNMAALNWYAGLNHYEAFACAFRAWCNATRETDGWFRQNRDELAAIDRQAVAFFDSLPPPPWTGMSELDAKQTAIR
jgi:hypothetical protein